MNDNFADYLKWKAFMAEHAASPSTSINAATTITTTPLTDSTNTATATPPKSSSKSTINITSLHQSTPITVATPPRNHSSQTSSISSSNNISSSTGSNTAEKKQRKYKKAKTGTASAAKSSRANDFEDIDPTHALVKWTVDGLLTVVPLGNIKKHYDACIDLIEDELYQCTWSANEVLEAMLITMGSSADCKRIQDQMKPKSCAKPKSAESSVVTAKPSVEQKLLADEVEVLKLKLKEMQDFIGERDKEISDIKDTLEQRTTAYNRLSAAFG